jgi:TRAP-type C4-dicarboxylate transport system substrate-binding protein
MYGTESTYLNNYYTFFKYVVQDEFLPSEGGIMANYAWFKTLPADLQKILMDDGHSVSLKLSNEEPGQTAAAQKALANAGLTVTTVNSQFQSQLTNLVQGPVIQLFEKNNGTAAVTAAKATPGF